jgi:hypothetical protein
LRPRKFSGERTEPLKRRLGGVVGLDACRGAQGLTEGPVADGVAVWEAMAADDGRVGSDAGEELVDESRLPDSGQAQDGDQLRRALVAAALRHLD